MLNSLFCQNLIFTTKIYTGSLTTIEDGKVESEMYNSDISHISRFDAEFELPFEHCGFDLKLRIQPSESATDYNRLNTAFGYFYLNLLNDKLQFKTGIVDEYNYLTYGDCDIDILWHKAGFLVNIMPVKGLSFGIFATVPYHDWEIYDIYFLASYRNKYFGVQAGLCALEGYYYLGFDSTYLEKFKIYLENELDDAYTNDPWLHSEEEIYFYPVKNFYFDVASNQEFLDSYYDFDSSANYVLKLNEALNLSFFLDYFTDFDSNVYSAGTKLKYKIFKNFTTSVKYTIYYDDEIIQEIQWNVYCKYSTGHSS